MHLKIQYKVNDSNETKEKSLDIFNTQLETEDFLLDIKTSNTFEVEIIPRIALKILNISLTFDYEYKNENRVFINGYQSWTDSKEVEINYKDKKFLPILKSTIEKYKFKQYGDYNFYNYQNKSGIFHSVTYSYIRKLQNEDEVFFIGSLNDDKSFTFIEHNSNSNKIIIKKDWVGKVIEKKEMIYKMLIKEGKEKTIFDEYFNLLGLVKKENKTTRGWTSWYNYYENITEDIIIKNLDNFDKQNMGLDYFQIDDGYQNAVGDWLDINGKFPKGMKYLADEIKKSGYKPGIWLAPFSAEKKSNLVKKHPNWILKDEKGEYVFGGSNWSSFYALDIYNKEFRAYLTNVFHVLINNWGYELFKLDFLYSACLLPRKDKTRAQVMTDAMKFLREIIGDKQILACGVPIVSSFGLVDYCRIGCDIGLDWDDKFYMKYMHRERISTKNAIKNSIYRNHLDGYAFYNDPDVFLLRNDNISLTKFQKETLFWVNILFGSLIFTSDDIAQYDDEQKSLYMKSFEIRSKEILEIKETNEIYFVKALLNNEKYLFVINLSKKTEFYKNNKVEAFSTNYWKMED